MNTETILENKSQWWIKFHKDTGKILKLSSKTIESTNKIHIVAITQNELCLDIIKGIVPVKQYGMLWDIESEAWNIDKKSDLLVIRHNSNFLHQIKKTDPTIADVAIRIYKNQNIVELNVNLHNIKRSMNLASINDVANKDGAWLNLYFTKRNDPDALIRSVEVDPAMLFKRKTVRFKLELDCDWDDISIFTRPIFSEYSIEKIDNFVSNVSVDNRSKVLQQSKKCNDDSHIYISNTGKRVTISHEIQQDYLINTHKAIRFVVCDEIVDNLVGGFEVPVKKLLREDSVNITVDFDMPENPIFLYKNKDIVVNYIGDNND